MKHFIFALTALTMLSCSQEAPRNVAELCDDDPSTSYAMPASRPCRVVFDGFDTPMRSYRVYSSGEVPAADPAGWVLSGSHDGRKWVELDRREGCVFCSRFQEITGRIANPRTIRPTKSNSCRAKRPIRSPWATCVSTSATGRRRGAVSSIPRWISRCLTHRPRVQRFTPRWCRIPGRMSATTPARLPKYFSTQLPIR